MVNRNLVEEKCFTKIARIGRLAGNCKRKIGILSTLFQPVGQKKRIVILDVLRGFALLGILMVNMQFFNVPFTITMREGRLWTDQLNTGAWWFIDFFFHGKFYVLFSLLFGMGFFLFLRKADEAGRAIVTIFRRRLLRFIDVRSIARFSAMVC